MRISRLLVICVAALTVTAFASGGIASAQTDDWPDTDSRDVSFGTHSGLISTASDTDRFRVPVSSGQVISLELSKTAGDEVDADIDYPGGGAFLSNDGGTGEAEEVTVEADGFVEVSVTGDPSGESIPWTVSVTDTGVRDQWNDRQSVQVGFGTHSGEINSDDDRDRFEIPVAAGQVLDLQLSKDAGDEVDADIDYPGGGSFLSNDGGTGESDQITIEADGFVEVSVDGDTAGSDLPWSVSVTDTGVRDQWNDRQSVQVELGSHSGDINSDDDRDRFRIPVTSGEVLALELTKEAGDEVDADIDYPGGGSFLSNDGGTGETDIVTIERDGFVEVSVDGDPTTDDLPWTVSVTDTGQRDQWNDRTAVNVDFGTHSGIINSDDDRDRFRIPVSAGEVVTVTLSKQSGTAVDADIDYPRDGAFLENDGGTGESDQVTIQEDGFVSVDVDGDTEGSGLPWTVSVLAGNNTPPTADAGTDRTVTAQRLVTLDASASTDPDGAISSYQWEQASGPSVSLSGAQTATPTFDAPAVTTETTLTFEVTVTDSDGVTATDTVRVTVAPAQSFVSVDSSRKDVTPGSAVTFSFTLQNPTQAETNLLLEVEPSAAGLTLRSFTGDVEQDLSGSTPPAAVTTPVGADGSATVSVTFGVSEAVSPQAIPVTVTASADQSGTQLTSSERVTVDVVDIDPLVARFGGSDGQIDNFDVLRAVNAANSGTEIGGEPVSNFDVLRVVNRVNQ